MADSARLPEVGTPPGSRGFPQQDPRFEPSPQAARWAVSPTRGDTTIWVSHGGQADRIERPKQPIDTMSSATTKEKPMRETSKQDKGVQEKGVEEKGVEEMGVGGQGPVEQVAEQGTPKKRGGHDERGMTTAEYAVGTVAAATLGGVLIKVFSDQGVFELILKIILWILTKFTGLGG